MIYFVAASTVCAVVVKKKDAFLAIALYTSLKLFSN